MRVILRTLAWLLLARLAFAQEKTPDQGLQGLAAKCGSEIPWSTSLGNAQDRARESKKPIAWWVPWIEDSPMDRKLVLEKYMLSGPFMMPPVVELLSKHFVPLRLVGQAAHREKFGLARIEFIEPGFVFLTPELKVIHRVDRISTFSEEWFTRLLGGVLRKAGRPVPDEKAVLGPGRRALYEGKPDPELFDKEEGPEARYFRGVALHLLGREEAARAEWKRLTEGRWAWKAAAELARDGPFVRGFEIYQALPPESLQDLPTSTTVPTRKPQIARAVRYLLETQRSTGCWDDSNYNFGGDRSLPNVYMAGTALAALALRAWGAPEEIRSAIERAEAYMRDESKVAPQDPNEIAWAHAYRLLYFAGSGDAAMIARLVRSLEDLQKETGVWRHEYTNPFVTATALHALQEAKKAGADVPDAVVRRGAAALRSSRGASGVYAYEYGQKGDRIEGGAGRMPFCEYALYLCGQSKAEAVATALEKSFPYNELLERIRKYDDHADQYHNGGFFFWYDQYGRAVAARGIGSAAALAKEREIVLAIPEIDGCWVDSHELGRSYGTSMALLVLKLCEP
jgi:hypothetical protein